MNFHFLRFIRQNILNLFEANQTCTFHENFMSLKVLQQFLLFILFYFFFKVEDSLE